jgi:threonine efflux protein
MRPVAVSCGSPPAITTRPSRPGSANAEALDGPVRRDISVEPPMPSFPRRLRLGAATFGRSSSRPINRQPGETTHECTTQHFPELSPRLDLPLRCAGVAPARSRCGRDHAGDDSATGPGPFAMTSPDHAGLLIALVAMLVVPGQDFVTVVRISASRSRGVGIAAAGGVSSGLLAWALAALLGLSTVLQDNTDLRAALGRTGAVLLIAIGAYAAMKTLVSRPRVALEPVSRGTAVSTPLLRGWVSGLMSNLSNAKLIVFFGSIFTGFLPHRLGPAEVLLVAAEVAVLALVWFSFVAVLGSHPRVSGLYRRYSRGLDVASGLVFIAIGSVLFASAA